MKKNVGIVWLRNDFRILKNDALSYATQNHDQVCVFYILKKKTLLENQHNFGGFIIHLKILKKTRSI